MRPPQSATMFILNKQILNAFLPMNETDDGIIISFNEVHPLKVPFKIDFIDDGIVSMKKCYFG